MEYLLVAGRSTLMATTARQSQMSYSVSIAMETKNIIGMSLRVTHVSNLSLIRYWWPSCLYINFTTQNTVSYNVCPTPNGKITGAEKDLEQIFSYAQMVLTDLTEQ